MLYKIHRHLESFLTFYYEHTKAKKLKFSSEKLKTKLTGSKGGRVVKKQKQKDYDKNSYGIDTIF